MSSNVSPLVLLHGFTGAPASWDGVAAHLPSDWSLIRPTLLGHVGAAFPPRSTSPEHVVTQSSSQEYCAPPSCAFSAVQTQSTFDAEVDRLAELVSSHLDTKAHLCGYSLGGRLALGLLCRHGHLFAGATLIGTHTGLRGLRERQERLSWEAPWIHQLRTESLRSFVSDWEALPLFATQRSVSKEARCAQRAIRCGQDPFGLAKALENLSLARMPDMYPHLPDLEMPVHFLVGARDLKFLDLAREARFHCPNATLHSFDECGHNLVLESPAQVADHILQTCLQERIDDLPV
ncbi:MAG: alpha/beta fold hydrolase [Myxococcota bacterium]